MTLDRDQLIRQVAEKHKVILGENDPILATVALHDVILAHYASTIDAAISRLQEAVVGTTAANTALLKQQTEQTLGQAVFRLKQVIDAGAAEIRDAARVAAQPQAPPASTPTPPPTRVSESSLVSLLTAAASFLCLVLVLITVFLMIHK